MISEPLLYLPWVYLVHAHPPFSLWDLCQVIQIIRESPSRALSSIAPSPSALQGSHPPVLWGETWSFSWGFICTCCHGCCSSTTGATLGAGLEEKKKKKIKISFCFYSSAGPLHFSNARREGRKKTKQTGNSPSHESLLQDFTFLPNPPAFAYFSDSSSSCFMDFIQSFQL